MNPPTRRPAISRKKFIAFALAAVGLALLGTFGALLGADLYAHRRFESAAGMNIWGYRGPLLGRKQPGEVRVAVLGGSTALGYGLPYTDAFPHRLQVALNGSDASAGRRFVVANLGFNNNGAYSFRFTLEDYAYLGYDVVVLYEGYNDLGRDMLNVRVSRRDSGVFRWFGYYPLLPTVVREKAMQLRYGGDLSAAYKGKAVFKPNFRDRAKASVLEASTALMAALEQTHDSGEQVNVNDLPPIPSEGCTERWAFYCHNVAIAVEAARLRHQPVLVVSQPIINAEHRDQQAELRAMIERRWASDPAVRYVALRDVVDLKDPALCWDGMHLTPAGNQRIAAGLVQPVLEVVPFVGR